MGKHIVVGSGQVGSHVAAKLASQGQDVTVVTRSGSGPEGVTKVAADVADQAGLIEITRGADAIYNCVNPPYHRWLTDWPPMAASFLAAAEASGAVLAVLGNLYPYGPVSVPMTEDLPFDAPDPKFRVRSRMWEDALALHRAGRIRMTEVRGSDYFGPGATDQSFLGDRFLKPLRAGKAIQLVWPADQPQCFDLPARRRRRADHGGGRRARLGQGLARAHGGAAHVPPARRADGRDPGPSRAAHDDAALAGAARGRAVRPDDRRAAAHPLPVHRALHPRLLGLPADLRCPADPLDQALKATLAA